MNDLKITTNRNWRPFTYRTEVPAGVLADQFDWTNEAHEAHGDYSDGFLRYRGVWYHLADFMVGGHEGWEASHGHSYFSGVLINISDNCESYQIARYSC